MVEEFTAEDLAILDKMHAQFDEMHAQLQHLHRLLNHQNAQFRARFDHIDRLSEQLTQYMTTKKETSQFVHDITSASKKDSSKKDAQNHGSEKTTVVPFFVVKPQRLVEVPKANDAAQFNKVEFAAEEVDCTLNPKRQTKHEIPLILATEIKIGAPSILAADRVEDSASLMKARGKGIILCTDDVGGAIAKAVNVGAIAHQRSHSFQAYKYMSQMSKVITYSSFKNLQEAWKWKETNSGSSTYVVEKKIIAANQVAKTDAMNHYLVFDPGGMKSCGNKKSGMSWFVMPSIFRDAQTARSFTLEWEPRKRQAHIKRRGQVYWVSGLLRSKRDSIESGHYDAMAIPVAHQLFDGLSAPAEDHYKQQSLLLQQPNAMGPTKREMTRLTGVDIVKSRILLGDLGVVTQLLILHSKRKFEKEATIYQLLDEFTDISSGKKSTDAEIRRYLAVYGQGTAGNCAFCWASHLFFTCVQSRKHEERLGNLLGYRFLNFEDMDVSNKILVFDPGGLWIIHLGFDESTQIAREQVCYYSMDWSFMLLIGARVGNSTQSTSVQVNGSPNSTQIRTVSTDKSAKESGLTILLVANAEEIINARFDNKVYRVLHRDDFGPTEHFVVGSQPRGMVLSIYFSEHALLAAESVVVLLNSSKIVSTIILGFVMVTSAISLDGSKEILGGQDLWKPSDGTFLIVTLVPSIKLVTAVRFVSTQLASIYGAAFQMQKELQCFDCSLLVLGVPCYSKIAGSLAGKHGQYWACMTYYIIYNLYHITKHSTQYKVLMLVHVLGGIATSLLLASFQSWLVAEHKETGFYIQ